MRNSSWLLIAFSALGVLTYVCVDAHGAAISNAIGREIPRPKDPPDPTEAALLIADTGDAIVLRGALPSERARDSLLGSVRQSFPARSIDASIAVEPSARERSWVTHASAWPSVLVNLQGGEVTATGEVVRVSGATEHDKESLLDKVRVGSVRVLDGIRVRTRKDQAQDAINTFLDAHTIEFEVSSVELTAASDALLKDFASLVKRDGRGFNLEIEGHTDNSGMIVANRALSKDRADRVRDALIRYGVDADKVTSRGYGSERPIADNGTEEGRKKNRRIEIHLR